MANEKGLVGAAASGPGTETSDDLPFGAGEVRGRAGLAMLQRREVVERPGVDPGSLGQGDVEQGIAVMDDRHVGSADNDTVCRSLDLGVGIMPRGSEMNASTWFSRTWASRGSMIRSTPPHGARTQRLGRPGTVLAPRQHRQMLHDTDDAAHTGTNSRLVEAQCLDGLVDDHRDPRHMCRPAQAALPEAGIEHHGNAEGPRPGLDFGTVQAGPDLGIVRTMPVRLAQTPTRCGMLPLAGIELGVGWRLYAGCDSEQ